MKEKLKKHETFRLIIQVLSFAFHNGYLKGWAKGSIYTGSNKTYCMPGLNCYSCPGAVGACPIGSLQAVLDSGKFKFSCYVFGFIAMVGLFCGRFVCGWLCPFGLVQDLVYKIPFKNKIKNLPGHKYLRYLRYVILLVFVILLPSLVTGTVGVGSPWYCEWICPSGTLIGGIPLAIAQPTIRGSIHGRFYWKIILLVVVLVGSVKSYRPFCKYVCPLGALYGLANPVSIYRLKVDKEKCIQCGSCQRVCGMDIKVWESPNSPDCIRCGRCKTACPKGAITSTFESLLAKTESKIGAGAAKKATTVAAVKKPAHLSSNDLSDVIAEELQYEAASAVPADGPVNADVPVKKDKRCFITGLILTIGPLLAILEYIAEVIIRAGKDVQTIMQFLSWYTPEIIGLFILSFTALIGVRLMRASTDSSDYPAIHTLAIRGIIYTVVLLVVGFIFCSVCTFIMKNGTVNLGDVGYVFERNLIQFPAVILMLGLAAFVTKEKK